MKELKDIKLRRGDVLFFDDGSIELFDIDDIYDCEIIKIKRPTQYETIYEAPKQILDKEEKEYLEAVIRPFKDRVKGIGNISDSKNFAYIRIELDNDWISLPTFRKGTMYKGIKLNKAYTLDELGLFKA